MTLATAAGLTLLQARTEMSQRMQDEGTAPFWTAAQKTTKLQYWFIRWHDRFFNRDDRMAGSATFASLAAAALSVDSVDATVKIWRHIHRQTVNSAILTGPEVEQMAPSRVRGLQISSPTPGPPTVVGLERRAANDVSGTVGTWTLWAWPIPDATYYFSAEAVRNAYFPQADGDFLDCTITEALIVATLAAIEGASLGGRDLIFTESLWRDVPQEVQTAMRAEMQAVTATQYQAGAEAAP